MFFFGRHRSTNLLTKSIDMTISVSYRSGKSVITIAMQRDRARASRIGVVLLVISWMQFGSLLLTWTPVLSSCYPDLCSMPMIASPSLRSSLHFDISVLALAHHTFSCSSDFSPPSCIAHPSSSPIMPFHFPALVTVLITPLPISSSSSPSSSLPA